MTSIGKDIEDYVKEMEAKFVNGSASFSQWEEYVNTLNKMGLTDTWKFTRPPMSAIRRSKRQIYNPGRDSGIPGSRF